MTVVAIRANPAKPTKAIIHFGKRDLVMVGCAALSAVREAADEEPPLPVVRRVASALELTIVEARPTDEN